MYYYCYNIIILKKYIYCSCYGWRNSRCRITVHNARILQTEYQTIRIRFLMLTYKLTVFECNRLVGCEKWELVWCLAISGLKIGVEWRAQHSRGCRLMTGWQGVAKQGGTGLHCFVRHDKLSSLQRPAPGVQ